MDGHDDGWEVNGEVNAAFSCGRRLTRRTRSWKEARSQNRIMVFGEQQPAKSEVWEVS